MSMPLQDRPDRELGVTRADDTVRRMGLAEVLEAVFLGTKRRIYLTMTGLCVGFGIVALVIPQGTLFARVALAVSESFLVALRVIHGGTCAW